METELKKIGLRLINVNVTDINDESGYIAALGKEAAAKAINEAKVSVAKADRDGSIGASDAEREQRIKVAKYNSDAITGENEAKITIAQSEANRREREAEFLKRAIAAEHIQAAKAKEESYAAERDAENARAELEKASQEADIIVKAEIRKREIELQAEAQAEQIRRISRGEADATLMKMEAQAKGMREILIKQAEGFEQLVKAAGGEANDAIRYMVAEKLEELVRIQVEAIQNLKIDKITVWDGGGAGNADGKTTTANFLSGIIKAVPPLNEMFDMAGMKLPDYLGKRVEAAGTEEKTE